MENDYKPLMSYGDHQKTASELMILTMMWQTKLGCLPHFRWMGIQRTIASLSLQLLLVSLTGCLSRGGWALRESVKRCKPLEHYTHLTKLVAGKWKEAAGATYVLGEIHGCPYPLRPYSGVGTGWIWWQGVPFLESWTFPIDRKRWKKYRNIIVKEDQINALQWEICRLCIPLSLTIIHISLNLCVN